MKQHGMRQVSYDTEVGKVSTDYRVLDVRRPFWSLGSMMDSGCDVHFTKDRCWKSKDDGEELDTIRSGGEFFVAARPAKPTSREASTLELNPMTSSRGTGKGARCVLESWVPLQEPRWTVMENQPTVRIKVPTGPATPSAEERALHEASGHVPYRSLCQWCLAARAADKPHLMGQQPETGEALQSLDEPQRGRCPL